MRMHPRIYWLWLNHVSTNNKRLVVLLQDKLGLSPNPPRDFRTLNTLRHNQCLEWKHQYKHVYHGCKGRKSSKWFLWRHFLYHLLLRTPEHLHFVLSGSRDWCQMLPQGFVWTEGNICHYRMVNWMVLIDWGWIHLVRRHFGGRNRHLMVWIARFCEVWLEAPILEPPLWKNLR